jgi:thimet oligopeptidase
MKIKILLAVGFFVLGSCAQGPVKKENNNELELVRSEYATGEITQLCNAAIKQTDERLNAFASKDVAQATFQGTILGIENAFADFTDRTTMLSFMQYVSPNEKIRAESAECESKSNQQAITYMARRDLYKIFKKFASGKDMPKEPVDRRLITEYIKAFENNGLKLSDEKLEKVKALKKQIADLETQFSANLNNDTSFVEFTEKELEGCPLSFLNRLKKSKDGKFIVTTKQTDYKAVQENASNEETRRRMLFAYANMAADKNVKLLETALPLRQEVAHLMGYKNWADLRTSEKMAKNSQKVFSFLNDIKAKLARGRKHDFSELLALKKETNPNATDIKEWDWYYYPYQLKKRNYDLDDELIREYFPTEVVLDGMFKIYSQLLGVKFVEVKKFKSWSPDVKLFETHDVKTGELISYFYMDSYPREGKYGHFAAFTLLDGRKIGDKYSPPVSAIVGNFNPPTKDKPSLMNHEEVETVFHEFGHIMHQTLTRSPYASLAGTHVARDFVEAPSQMMEEWTWVPEFLNMVSGHYKDHSKKLPKDLLEKMVKARTSQRAAFYSRQLALAMTDMMYNTQSGPVDTTAIIQKNFKELWGITPLEGTHYQSTWGHLMGGYDAGYYGYLWSKVYAIDMFSKFEKEGLLNASVGSQYRKSILESGNMQEPMELIKKFLGRTPNSKAFFKNLGV